MAEEKRRRQFLSLISLAGVALVALGIVFFSLAAQGKDNPEDFTRVYAFTYDEVFQAAEKAVLRLGWNATNSDKDKGTIQGTLTDDVGGFHVDQFEAHIETVSSQPRTKVALDVKAQHHSSWVRRTSTDHFFSELQKVLATYQ